MNVNMGLFVSFGDVFGLGFTRSDEGMWIGLGPLALKWEVGTGREVFLLGKRLGRAGER